MESKYKCANCNKLSTFKNKIYIVKDSKGLNNITCSRECAKEFIKKEVVKLKIKINEIENQNIELGNDNGGCYEN